MIEQKFVYVDVNYLKELEEKAKEVDYYKGVIDGITMVADRKTENCSEKPNNCEDEPKYEMGMGTLKCDNCSEYGSFKCTKCDGEMYFKRLEPKTEPQTCEDCKHWGDTEDGCADRHGCKTTEDCSMVWTKENCKGCKYNEYPYDSGTCFVRVCINGNKYELKYEPQTERSGE